MRDAGSRMRRNPGSLWCCAANTWNCGDSVKPPRFTDGRYPHGYTPSSATDIRRTFARIKRQIAEQQREQDEKVSQIKPRVRAK